MNVLLVPTTVVVQDWKSVTTYLEVSYVSVNRAITEAVMELALVSQGWRICLCWYGA